MLTYHRMNTVFPDGFIEETLQTLSLLFPRRDNSVIKWYKRKGEPEDLDMSVFSRGPASRRIENYRFWRDRLVLLKEAYDESRPSNFSQWWHDRRDGIQWYTLWIALSLTLLFGLVQSIEGAIQTYVALHVL